MPKKDTWKETGVSRTFLREHQCQSCLIGAQGKIRYNKKKKKIGSRSVFECKVWTFLLLFLNVEKMICMQEKQGLNLYIIFIYYLNKEK